MSPSAFANNSGVSTDSGSTTWSTARERCSRNSPGIEASSSCSECEMLPYLATIIELTYNSWRSSLATIAMSAGEAVDSRGSRCLAPGEGKSSVKDSWSVRGCFCFENEKYGFPLPSSACSIGLTDEIWQRFASYETDRFVATATNLSHLGKT